MSRIIIAFVSMFVLACQLYQPIALAESPWSQPVRRNTDSRTHDLVAALLDQNRLDDAKEICLAERKAAQPLSDDSAKWAILLSQIATKRQMLGDTFDNAGVILAQKPVADLLQSYPDHPRALFLNTQLLVVMRESARHQVVIASVSPRHQQNQDQIFSSLARVTSELAELGSTIDAKRAALDSNAKSIADRALSKDLLRLHQETLIDVVSMALLQTELFTAGGRDYIASANKAEQAAEKALMQLPSDSSARIDIDRLRVQAILRSGQYDRAAAQLHQLMRMAGPPLPSSILALRLRLATARKRHQDASQQIREFYGTDVGAAPKSVEMDLARLDFLLSSPDPKVGDWIDQIEARNGAFARRRAEAIALARLKSSGSSHSGDASMIAAQGQDWLRRGDPQRASDLLVAAARAEQQPDRAITRATEAAAALIAANRATDAATILLEVSLANATGKNAAQASLQAAHLQAKTKTSDAAALVENSLRSVLKHWPESDQADQARIWLIKLLRSQNQIVSAAQVATDVPIRKATAANLNVASELWQQAARVSNDAEIHELGKLFRNSFAPLLPAAVTSYREVAAFVLDEESLSILDDVQASSDDSYHEKLFAFRRNTNIKQLEAPPVDLLEDVIWRLMRDGRRNPLLRKRNATVIQSWTSTDQVSLDRIERTLWLGNAKSAIKAVHSMAAASKSPGKVISDAARLFGASDDRNARLEAIKLWDQFASGINKGTPSWHDAKLQSITLLSTTGSQDQAFKRAKFVLLTSPPKDQAVRRQYEAIVNQK